MLLRVSTQPLEIEESVYEYLSKEHSITYEPTPVQPSATSSALCADQSPLPATQELSIPSQPNETWEPLSNCAVAIQKPDISQPLGLPQDWIIFPLPQNEAKRRKSVRIQVNPKDTRTATLSGQDGDPSGSIDIDWDDPDEPVKFSARQYSATNGPTLQEALDTIPPSPSTNLDPICFSITSEKASVPSSNADPDIPLQTLKHSPTLLTESDLYDLRRASRHNIRVVTRNSLGLLATTALSGVAPQLLIAASINAYCLSRGAEHLHEHQLKLQSQGLRIRKRDISVAVAEGVVVKLALMVVTINHDDFLVFANTFAAPFAVDVLSIHDTVSSLVPGLDAVSAAFVAPVERLQEALGITTMEERAVDAASCGSGGWNEPSKMLLQNIFDVGAVQAGLETAVEIVQKKVGWATREAKARAYGVVHPYVKRKLGRGVKDDMGLGLAWGKVVGRPLVRRRSTL